MSSCALPEFAGPVTSVIGMLAHPGARARRARRSRVRGPAAPLRRASLPDGRPLAGLARALSRGVLLGVGRFGPLLGPQLVELHPPFALLRLAQGEVRAEAAPATTAKAGHCALGVTPLDQLAGDRDRQLLAGFRLPDHEPAAWILAGPARVALSVLDDLMPAYRARPQPSPGDAHVLERLVELLDRLLREAGYVAHEPLARILAPLDLAQALLPAARQPGRGERVLVEQPDHVQPLLGGHERTPVALHVADGDQALDDRRARRRRADARVLHRLAQLFVVDELARRLHPGQQRGVAVAPRRVGFLAQALDLAGLHVLPLEQPRQLLIRADLLL